MEEGTAYTSHTYENGSISHHSDVDSLTGMATFVCLECGYEKRFSTVNPKPKWLQERLDAVINIESPVPISDSHRRHARTGRVA
jgi:hypothetical protein